MTQADELPITTDAPNQWIVFDRRIHGRAVAADQDAATRAVTGLMEDSPLSGPYSIWEYIPTSRLTAAQEQVERLRGLCAIALDAWEGTGPPIMLDDLRDAVAGQPLGAHIPRLVVKESKG